MKIASPAKPDSNLQIAVRCPRCGDEVRTINKRAYSGEFVALVKCLGRLKHCQHEWVVRMVIAPASMSKVTGKTEHGTEAGYMAHYRKGQKPCVACREAHALSAQMSAERRKARA